MCVYVYIVYVYMYIYMCLYSENIWKSKYLFNICMQSFIADNKIELLTVCHLFKEILPYCYVIFAIYYNCYVKETQGNMFFKLWFIYPVLNHFQVFGVFKNHSTHENRINLELPESKINQEYIYSLFIEHLLHAKHCSK